MRPSSWIQHTNTHFRRILYYGPFLLLLRSVWSRGNREQRNTDFRQNFNASCQLTGSSSNATKICLTSECIVAASYLLSSMDKSVDPCEDFYQFSCGGWMEKHLVPEGQKKVSVLSELEKKIENDLILLLEEKIKRSEADHVKKIKQIYKSCMDIGAIEDAGYKPLDKIVESLNSKKYDWMGTLKLIRKAGFKTNFPLPIGVFGNHIKIDSPSIKFKEIWNGSFFDNFFQIQNTPHALSTVEQIRKVYFDLNLNRSFSNEKEKISWMNNIINGIFSLFTFSTLLPHELQKHFEGCFLLILSPLDEDDHQHPDETYKRIIHCLYWSTKGMKIEVNKRNRRDFNNEYEYTVKELQEKAPEIDWLKYFSILFDDSINENDTLRIPEFDPIRYIAKFMKGTHKGDIFRYYLWKVEKEYSDLFKELTQKEIKREKRCLGYIEKYLGKALESFYMKRYFTQEKKAKVLEIGNFLRTVFAYSIESRFNGMVKYKLRQKFPEKVWGIKVKAGYPEELLDEISNLYKDLKISTDYINNHLKLKKLETDREFSRIRKQKTGWEQFPKTMDTNIKYDFNNDGINVPPGRVLSPFFHMRRPQYLNFGGLGSAMGAGFASIFSHKDSHKDRNTEPWWGAHVEETYNESFSCISEQYNNYTEQMGLKPTSKFAKLQDLADNLGLILAYQANIMSSMVFGIEAHLPGLEEYSPWQLFWISFASGMCEKYKQGSLDSGKQSTRGLLRVHGSVSNRPEFARDFKCRLGAKMNPGNKCEYFYSRVWKSYDFSKNKSYIGWK